MSRLEMALNILSLKHVLSSCGRWRYFATSVMSIKSNWFDLLKLLREEWSTFIGVVPNKSRLRMQNIKLEVKFRAAPPSNNHSPSSSLLMPHSLRFNENKAVSDTIAQVNTARDTVLMAPRIKTNLTIYKEGNDILQMKWASKEVRKRHFCTFRKLLDVSPTSDKTLKTTVKGWSKKFIWKFDSNLWDIHYRGKYLEFLCRKCFVMDCNRQTKRPPPAVRPGYGKGTSFQLLEYQQRCRVLGCRWALLHVGQGSISPKVLTSLTVPNHT